jgi:hypothetical protein
MFSLDPKAFLASMAQGARALSALIVESLKRSATQGAQYAKVNTLWKSRTGRLRAGITHRMMPPFAARITSSAKHSGYVEDGTKAHWIRPKALGGSSPRQRKTLSFVQNGVRYFRKEVFHPGTQPRPFMQKARDRVEPLFDRLCRLAVDRMFG